MKKIYSIISIFLILSAGYFLLGFGGCGPSETTPDEEPISDLERGITPPSTSVKCDELQYGNVWQEICDVTASCLRNEKCSTSTIELFCGVTVDRPTDFKTKIWNNFGSRGEILAQAALCSLKDLNKGAVTLNTSSKAAELEFKANQTIGFVSFDWLSRTFKGYQNLEVCAPIVGCFDAKTQAIQAVLRQRTPAQPKAKSVGEFAIKSSYGLEVSAEESDQSIEFKLPFSGISTPYGSLDLTPKIEYTSALKSQYFFPLNESLQSWSPKHREILLQDHYGRYQGVVYSSSVDPAQVNLGWQSHVGLGQRQADPEGIVWPFDPDKPRRPDLDLSKARNSDEKQNVVKIDTTVTLAKLLPIPAPLLVPPLVVEFNAFIDAKLKSFIANQFFLYFGEGQAEGLDGSVGSLNLAKMLLKARVENQSQMGLNLGIDFSVKISTLFTDITLVDEHPRKEVVLDKSFSADEKIIASASSIYNPRLNEGAPVLTELSTANSKTITGSATQDFLTSCAEMPVISQKPNKPSFKKGDASFMNAIEYPCNICIGTPAYVNREERIAIDAFTTLSTVAGGGPKDWICSDEHIGCFDVCSFNAGTNALTVKRTAIEMKLRGRAFSDASGTVKTTYSCGESRPK